MLNGNILMRVADISMLRVKHNKLVQKCFDQEAEIAKLRGALDEIEEHGRGMGGKECAIIARQALNGDQHK